MCREEVVVRIALEAGSCTNSSEGDLGSVRNVVLGYR